MFGLRVVGLRVVGLLVVGLLVVGLLVVGLRVVGCGLLEDCEFLSLLPRLLLLLLLMPGKGLSSSSLQKSLLHKQAKMDPLRSSVMSLGLHEDLGTSGSEIDPSNTRVGKHSRNVATSLEDFFHEYIKHASSLVHVCTWAGSVRSNLSHFLFGLSRLPHEKHCNPGLSGCTTFGLFLFLLSLNWLSWGFNRLGNLDFVGRAVLAGARVVGAGLRVAGARVVLRRLLSLKLVWNGSAVDCCVGGRRVIVRGCSGGLVTAPLGSSAPL